MTFKPGDLVSKPDGDSQWLVSDLPIMSLSAVERDERLRPGEWQVDARAVYFTGKRADLLRRIVNAALLNFGEVLTIDEKIDLGKMVAEARGEDD